MPAARRIVCLYALGAMLMLSACSRSVIAGEGLPANQIEQGSTPTPVVLATHPASTMEQPVHLVIPVAYYTPGQAPLQDIFGNLGGVYLNLITCAGDWIASEHQTKLRLVVYTTLV